MEFIKHWNALKIKLLSSCNPCYNGYEIQATLE